jgi:hypothetical protein
VTKQEFNEKCEKIDDTLQVHTDEIENLKKLLKEF